MRCSQARSTSPGTRTPRTSRRRRGSAATRRCSECATSTRTSARSIVTRRGEPLRLAAGARRQAIALGSRDSGHAAILPLHYLAAGRARCATETTLLRFDTDLGKHGDTGDSELRVVRAVADGDADAGALGDATWAAHALRGIRARGELEVAWRSPTYFHCNFTALPSFDREPRRAVDRGAARDELRRSGVAERRWTSRA